MFCAYLKVHHLTGKNKTRKRMNSRNSVLDLFPEYVTRPLTFPHMINVRVSRLTHAYYWESISACDLAMGHYYCTEQSSMLSYDDCTRTGAAHADKRYLQAFCSSQRKTFDKTALLLHYISFQGNKQSRNLHSPFTCYPLALIVAFIKSKKAEIGIQYIRK